jgi:Tfp pilus assembly protein PilF
VLAEQLNDQVLAEQLNSQLAMLEQDPFELLATAINARNNGKLFKAKQQLEDAIALAPYLSEPYIELAIISYQQGNEQSSKEWLEKAIEIENKDEKLALYHAKLFALKDQH